MNEEQEADRKKVCREVVLNVLKYRGWCVDLFPFNMHWRFEDQKVLIDGWVKIGSNEVERVEVYVKSGEFPNHRLAGSFMFPRKGPIAYPVVYVWQEDELFCLDRKWVSYVIPISRAIEEDVTHLDKLQLRQINVEGTLFDSESDRFEPIVC